LHRIKNAFWVRGVSRSRLSDNQVLVFPGEGIHFIIPFAEQVIQLEVRTLKFEANATAASNDLQEVQTTIALNYHISPDQANIIYQQLGVDYADKIIAPTIQESVKASVAKFNAEELITKRATAKAVIAQSIANTLGARNIVVESDSEDTSNLLEGVLSRRDCVY
jgi:prohibitin 2